MKLKIWLFLRSCKHSQGFLWLLVAVCIIAKWLYFSEQNLGHLLFDSWVKILTWFKKSVGEYSAINYLTYKRRNLKIFCFWSLITFCLLRMVAISLQNPPLLTDWHVTEEANWQAKLSGSSCETRGEGRWRARPTFLQFHSPPPPSSTKVRVTVMVSVKQHFYL